MSLIEKIPVRLIGLTFISVVLVSTFIFISLVVLEISGASSILEKKIPKTFRSVYETEYYGERLTSDPYSKFTYRKPCL